MEKTSFLFVVFPKYMAQEQNAVLEILINLQFIRVSQNEDIFKSVFPCVDWYSFWSKNYEKNVF